MTLISVSFGSKLKDYEETIFWILVYIMRELNWRDMYTHDYVKMRKLTSAFEFRLKENLPELYEHIQDSGVCEDDEYESMFQVIFPHFTTILLDSIPIKYTDRILDVFLLEGEKLILDIYLRIYYLSYQDIMKRNSKYVRRIVLIMNRNYGSF